MQVVVQQQNPRYAVQKRSKPGLSWGWSWYGVVLYTNPLGEGVLYATTPLDFCVPFVDLRHSVSSPDHIFSPLFLKLGVLVLGRACTAFCTIIGVLFAVV